MQNIQLSKIKTSIIGLCVMLIGMFFVSLGLLSQPAAAQSTAKEAVCKGIGAATGSGDCSDAAGDATVDNTLKSVINILSLVVAVIAVIMIIIGGLKYVTSNGDSGSTTSARNTIIYALVGLLIVVLSQAIVRFVIGTASESAN